MRKLAFLIAPALFILAAPELAHADLFTVISQEYHIAGSGDAGGIPFGYSETADHALSRYAEHSGPGGGYIAIWTDASGTFSADSITLNASNNNTDSGVVGAISSEAFAQVTFQPYVSQFTFTMGAHGLDYYGFGGLYDVTSALWLFQVGQASGVYDPVAAFSISQDLLLDVTHIYTLFAQTSYVASGIPNGSDVTLTGHAVPEPSTLLLFGVGLIGLAAGNIRRS